MVDMNQFPEIALASLVRTLPTKLFINVISKEEETVFKGYVKDLLETPTESYYKSYYEDMMESNIFKITVKDNGLILELF